jgi:hypothetical protein
MKKTLVIIVCVLSAFVLYSVLYATMNKASADEWTDADTHREVAYEIFHAADWLQTRSVAKAGWTGGMRKILSSVKIRVLVGLTVTG